MPVRIGDKLIGYDRGSRTFFAIKVPVEQKRPPMGEVGKAGESVFAGWGTENADDLVKVKGLGVYSEMLTKDESVAAGIRLLAMAVVGGGYEVAPSDVKEGAAQEVATFVGGQLEGLDGPFKAVELGILSGRWAGFSVSELNWGEVVAGEYAGNWGLSSIKTKPPYSYGFKLDQFGNIVELVYDDGMGTADAWDWTDPAVRNKWCLYTHDAGDAFGSPYGRSALRCVYRYFRARQLAFPMWAMYIEKAAGLMPVMSYPRGITPAEVAGYEAMVKKVTTASSIAKPEDVGIEFLGAMQTKDDFEKFDNFCSASILRGILVPTQLGIAADTKVGSQAKATVHERLFDWVSGDMDAELTAAVNEQIVRPLVDYNYDVELGQYPEYRRKEKDPDDAIAIVTAFVAAYTGKTILEIALEDENRVRQLLGFSEVSEDDWEERQAAAEERAKAMADALKESGGDDDDDDPKSSRSTPTGKDKAKTADTPGGKDRVKVDAERISIPELLTPEDAYALMGQWFARVYGTDYDHSVDFGRVRQRDTWSRIQRGLHDGRRRGLNEFERSVGLKPDKIRKRLDRTEDQATDYIVGAMETARTWLLRQLRKQGFLDGSGTLKALWSSGGFKGDAKRMFRDALYATMVNSYIEGATDTRKEILKATKGKAEFSRLDAGPELLQFTVGEGMLFDPTEALAYWDKLVPMSATLAREYMAESFWMAGVYLDDHGELMRQVKEAIRTGFTSGNWSTVETNINSIFKEWVGSGQLAQQSVDGKFTTASPWHTRIIVRNASMRSYNAGRHEQMRAAGSWVQAYQWSSIIDSRTSDYCDMMDGQVFHEGEIEFPPAHHQCRSMVTPVVRGMKYTAATPEALARAVSERDPGWSSGVID